MKYEIAILGADGLLGGELALGLQDKYSLIQSSRRGANNVKLHVSSTDEDFISFFSQLMPNAVVINAIGKLTQNINENSSCDIEDAILVNSLFPQRLARLTEKMGLRLIHFSTDAVFSRSSGAVDEHSVVSPEGAYGASKLLGETRGGSSLTIRCSFVGVKDSIKKTGMWAWILGLGDRAEIMGYKNQAWSGVTTNQLVDLCDKLINKKVFLSASLTSSLHHFCPNPVITKYQLAKLIAACCRPDVLVSARDDVSPVTRILVSRFNSLNKLVANENQQWQDLIIGRKVDR
jgi:dTDP-4-dehydrorhamnose reductase